MNKMENAEYLCRRCGSKNIESGIAIALSNEVGNVGPKYSVNFMMAGVSQLYCDLCLDCGDILRFYIKDKTDRKWIKKSGTVGSP